MNRGRGRYRHPRGGRGWSHVGRARQPEPLPDLPKGSLIEAIKADDLDIASLKNTEYVGISDVELIASYNWVNSPGPEIMIPGKPARWTPPVTQQRLQEDDPDGTYYRDLNAASYPKHPTEPTMVSIMKMHPSSPKDLELFACGSTLGNLLRFVDGSDQPFRILVNVVDNVVHLIRREKSPLETVVGIQGFGHTFPEANTTWDDEVRDSTSHQRILRYRLDGINTLIRYEADGYLPPASDARSSKPESKPKAQHHDKAPDDADILLDGLKVTTKVWKKTAEHRQLVIRSGGEVVPQDRVFDLKTRTHKRKNDDILGGELHRLWLRQMEHFVLGFHQYSVFQDVTVHDIKDKLLEWERSHQRLISSLSSLLRIIMRKARGREDGRLEVVYAGSGPLEIREQLADAGEMLSDKTLGEWKVWLNRNGGDAAQEDLDSDSDGEFWDFTSCSRECNYCGKCPF